MPPHLRSTVIAIRVLLFIIATAMFYFLLHRDRAATIAENRP